MAGRATLLRAPAPVRSLATPPVARRARPPEAQMLTLQRQAGNAAVARLVQRTAPGGCGPACACSTCGGGNDERESIQRRVDQESVDAVSKKQIDGTGGALFRLNGLSTDDQVQTIAAMPVGDRQFLEAALRAGVGTGQFDVPRMWMSITTAGADPVRAKRAGEVHSQIRAGRWIDDAPPFGAIGLLADLKAPERVGVLRLLHADHLMALAEHIPNATGAKGGASRDVEGVKQAMLEAVRTTPDLMVKRIPFPLNYDAKELVPSPAAPATATGTSTFITSQGEHAVAPNPMLSGRRLITRNYWKALIPEPRAVELERALNQLPRDLAPKMESYINGQIRTGKIDPRTAHRFGQVPQAFAAEELASIPTLVLKYNAHGAAGLTEREMFVLSKCVQIHVDGVPAQVRVGQNGFVPGGGSPMSSWSTPGKVPYDNLGEKKFSVKAEFDRQVVLDNTKPSPVGPGNAEEAEWMVFASKDARVTSVRPLGEAGPGTNWAFRNAGTLRWAGRGILLVSIGYSIARVLSADPEEFTQVLGQELGAQAGGFAGAALGAAACIALGVATGGIGLLACGLAGGMLGGTIGGALGGAMGSAMDQEVMPVLRPLSQDPILGPAIASAAAPEVIDY